jgi:phage head maturation protease
MTILTRAYQADLQVRDEPDGRVLFGPVVPWNVEARVFEPTVGRVVVEVFERGSLADVDPASVPLTARHPTDNEQLPIGATTQLRDESDAMHGEWFVPDTQAGNEVLALVAAGARLALSVGFVPAPGGSRWTHNRSRVTRVKAGLDHIAIVRRGAYRGAAVVGVRAADGPAIALPRATLARRRHG